MSGYQEIEELNLDELNNLTGFIGEILKDAQNRATKEMNSYLSYIRNHNRELFELFFNNDLHIGDSKTNLSYAGRYGIESSNTIKELRNKLAKKYTIQTVRSMLEEQRKSKQNKK